MLHKKIENFLKKVLPFDRYLHRKICTGCGLSLDYRLNKDSVSVLEAIFIHREYADYFPMLQSATIVDVGGHYGFFSFFAALHAAPDARIYALEPSEKNFDTLIKNLEQNSFSNIHAFALALDGQSGQRLLYEGPSYNHSFFGPTEKGKTSVPTLSLKDFIQQQQLEKIDFLKLDCEGAEFPILLTADADDLAIIKTISLEFHDLPAEGYTSLQILKHLRQHHFEIVQYHHDSDYYVANMNFGKIIATKAS